MRHLIIICCCLFMHSCGSGGSNDTAAPTTPVEVACVVESIETEIDSTLQAAASNVDFTFSVKREDGRQYTFDRGNSSLQTLYESASTSKLVSAVIILRLVELGHLSLSDRPQDYISTWPSDSTNPLFNITLAQLLSFTSGLEIEPLCLNAGGFDFEACVDNIATRNTASPVTPGQSFYYAGTHLQVAGLMAYQAFGGDSWQAVFSDFKTQTGLFSNSSYDLPSSGNPRLAGGMHWLGDDYLDFLLALKNGEILNENSMALLLTDHTADVIIAESPAFDGLGEDWHYGFGLWHECESTVFNCELGGRVSSPGAFGAYPFWDQQLDYIGLVARQGPLGSFQEGIELERTVRETVERWAACE